MMDARLVRVRMAGEDPYGSGSGQITVDVLIDGDGNLIKGLPYFGAYGPVAGQDTSPFVLRADQSVDFGSCCDEDERMAEINLRERPVRLGNYITFYKSDRDRQQDHGWPFRITSVMDVADLVQAHS